VNHPADLAVIPFPQEVTGGRAGAVVGNDKARIILFDVIDIPKLSRRNVDDDRRFERKILRRRRHPIEKWPPNICGSLSIKPLEDHRDAQGVAGFEK
jgi:hypothetical protein